MSTPDNNINKSFFLLTLGFSLTASAVLGLELILSGQGKSLCHTSACEIVAHFIRFGEPALLALGCIFFLLLAGVIFFAQRYPISKKAIYLPIILIIGAAAYDGTLIGFQFITLRQKCLICISIAASLGLISLLYSISIRKWLPILACLSAWGAGFMASATLIMPDETKAASGMIFYQRKAQEDSVNPPQATLIFSMKCPHCKHVLEYLAKKNPDNLTWQFAITDQDVKTINKLGFFYKKAAKSTNPFRLLLEAKKNKSVLPNSILAKFPALTRKARIFLSNNNITAVPVLIYKKNASEQTIIEGSDRIIDFLKTIDQKRPNNIINVR